MLRLLLTTVLLSLYSAVSSTSEYSKIGEGWYPSSSVGSFETRGGRDRRTTHWDSGSHSNLDDDRRGVDEDIDRGHSQMPYPLLVGQPSSPGFSQASALELASRNTNEIDFSDDESLDNDSRLDHCITVIRKPILLVPFAGAERSLDDISDVQLNPTNSAGFRTIRCRRRINGWTIQEPVYVEEPRWVFIDLNRQIGSGGLSINEDPFYVARGKRSLQLSDDIGRARSKKNTDYNDISNQDENSSTENEEKNVPTISRRRKRNALGDILRSSLFADSELGFPRLPSGIGADGGKGHAHGYVSPRNKHGNIMDILNEPFFISRGKKDSMKLRRFNWIDKYARQLMLNDNFRATNFRNCDPTKKDCFLQSSNGGSQVDPRFINDPFAFRDRRGIMEDLLREADPFYLARGKRSSSSSATKNDNDFSNNRFEDSSNIETINERPISTTSRSQSTTEKISENLSIVQ